ncbi:MAG: GAF domain-containing protein [Dermatophilaceae bacterium]
MDAAAAFRMFYAVGRQAAPGLLQIHGWESTPWTEAAQAVQRSAFPDAYAKWQRVAEQIVADPGVLSAVCTGGARFVSDVSRWAGVLGIYDGNENLFHAPRAGKTVEVVHDVFGDPYYAAQFALATRPGGTAWTIRPEP